MPFFSFAPLRLQADEWQVENWHRFWRSFLQAEWMIMFWYRKEGLK
jgi:hypothetical protein